MDGFKSLTLAECVHADGFQVVREGDGFEVAAVVECAVCNRGYGISHHHGNYVGVVGKRLSLRDGFSGCDVNCDLGSLIVVPSAGQTVELLGGEVDILYCSTIVKSIHS